MVASGGLRAASVAALVLSGACAPKLRPLAGAPAPVALPAAQLAPGHRRVLFRWELEDRDLSARGEGAARIAAPDSARLDFFLGGGLAGGAAVLIDGDLRLPTSSAEFTRRLVPPPPLLWAALGRLAVPVTPDTVVRVDGDTLRADIGTPSAWRLTFVRDTLRHVARIEGGRIVEWVDRSGNDRVRYRHEGSRRQLDLFITRVDDIAPAFDADIWQLP